MTLVYRMPWEGRKFSQKDIPRFYQITGMPIMMSLWTYFLTWGAQVVKLSLL